MIGILIASHGDMAKGLLNSAGMLIGEQEQVQALCLKPSDNADEFQGRMEAAIKELDSGDGVLVFTDIMGGTPGNKALAIAAANKNVEVVAGVNIPVFLEVALSRDGFNSLDEAVECVLGMASSCIVCTSKQLDNSDSSDDLDADME